MDQLMVVVLPDPLSPDTRVVLPCLYFKIRTSLLLSLSRPKNVALWL